MLETKKRCKNNFQTCVGELQPALVYYALLHLMFKYCITLYILISFSLEFLSFPTFFLCFESLIPLLQLDES